MCALSAKEIGYLEDHLIESVTENWRYFRYHGPFVRLANIVCAVSRNKQ